MAPGIQNGAIMTDNIGMKPSTGKQVDDTEPEPPYSVFSPGEKKFIAVLASLAALFSPLSANIYYPALNSLATDLKVSSTLINLTITSYLVPHPLVKEGASANQTADISRTRPDVRGKHFRRDWSKALISGVFRHLYRRQYRSSLAEKLCGLVRSSLSAELWE